MFELADPDVLTVVGGALGVRNPATVRSWRVAGARGDRAISVATDRPAFDALEAEWTELDRIAERRDETAWIETQTVSPSARYLLLDAAGEAFMQRDRDALCWLGNGERERWLEAAYRSADLPDKPRNVIGLQKTLPVAEMEAALVKGAPIGQEDLKKLAEKVAEALGGRGGILLG